MIELSDELVEKLDELAMQGNEYADEEKYDDAIQIWEKALDMIPKEQQHLCGQAVWFEACIGDMYFQKNMFAKAFENFDAAVKNLSGEGTTNPFVLLRLGECYLELGDEKNATEYLLRAYMMEGKEIFFDEDSEECGEEKYYEFLRTHVEHIE